MLLKPYLGKLQTELKPTTTGTLGKQKDRMHMLLQDGELTEDPPSASVKRGWYDWLQNAHFWACHMRELLHCVRGSQGGTNRHDTFYDPWSLRSGMKIPTDYQMSSCNEWRNRANWKWNAKRPNYNTLFTQNTALNHFHICKSCTEIALFYQSRIKRKRVAKPLFPLF